ncbi:MAG: hypothetical protein ACLVJO_11050 [[Clostridium] scindens]
MMQNHLFQILTIVAMGRKPCCRRDASEADEGAGCA